MINSEAILGICDPNKQGNDIHYTSSYILMFQLWPPFGGCYTALLESKIILEDIFDIYDPKNLGSDLFILAYIWRPNRPSYDLKEVKDQFTGCHLPL